MIVISSSVLLGSFPFPMMVGGSWWRVKSTTTIAVILSVSSSRTRTPPCQESGRNVSRVGFIEIENPVRSNLFQNMLNARCLSDGCRKSSL
jgi:hypothetical protein